MSKQNPSSRTPKLDMNPMVDMAFLLVSFFMLTTTFKTMEPVQINRPASQTEQKMPQTDLMTITVADDGRLFCSVDGKFVRQRLLARMGQQYGQSFNSTEKEQFSLVGTFGMPLEELPDFLALPPTQRNAMELPGIPCDSIRNELRDWIANARITNPRVRFSINADRDTPYSHVERVVQTFTDQQIYRFSLVTELEAAVQ